MTHSITVSQDGQYARAGITLAGFATTDPVQIYRIHSDGSQYPIRTVPTVSAGQAFAWDYECPFKSPVTYQCYDVPTVRTNYQTNPRFVGTMGNNGWDANANVTYTAANSQLTVANVSGTNVVGYGVLLLNESTDNSIPVNPGDVWTHSITITNNEAVARSYIIRHYPGAASGSDTFTTTSIPAGATATISVTATVAAGESNVQVYVYAVSMPAGASATLSGPLSELSSTVGTFFDGYSLSSDTVEYGWLGDPDNSPSTQTTLGASYSSASFTLDLDQFWLRCPGQPDLDMEVDVLVKPSRTMPIQSATLQPIGRTNAVVVQGARASAQFDLSISAHTTADSDSVEALIYSGAAALLLVMPGTRLPWQYVAVLNVTDSPVAPFRTLTGDDAGAAQDWTLSCVVTDAPIGGIFGDSTDSYASLLAAESTYATVKADYATYLDVLKGTG